MLAIMRRFFAAAALAGGLAPTRMNAQASPYLPLDDPRLPLLEHLIARGDVDDPSPTIRPFRRSDAERVLSAADTLPEDTAIGCGCPAKLIHSLRRSLADPVGENA
jgi:hypothetical protein